MSTSKKKITEITENKNEEEKHCSFCKYFFSKATETSGNMFCTKLMHKITSKRQNACKYFERIK